MPGFGGGSFGRGPFGASDVIELETVENEVALVETVSIVEQLVVSRTLSANVSETVSLSVQVRTGSFQIETIGGNLVRVTFPTELHYDGILDASNYLLGPDFGGNPGAPLALLSVEALSTVLQDGSEGAVVPEALGGEAFDLSDGLSRYFRLTGEINAVTNLGDFITITTGQNAGLYQILAVLETGPPEAVVVLDRPLVILDGASGVQSIQSYPELTELDDLAIPVDLQLLSIVGDVYTFCVKHPAVTPSNPVLRTYRVSRRARVGSTAPLLNAGSPEGVFVPQGLFSLLNVTLIDYRTFSVEDASAPSLRGTSLAAILDRFETVVQVQASVEWSHTTGVQGVDLTTTKLSNEKDYLFHLQDVFGKLPKNPAGLDGEFRAQGVPLPKIVETSINAEGAVTVVYDEPMQQDPAHLSNPADYVITGPSDVFVRRVYSLDDFRVVLVTQGLGGGDYTLTVSTNTPKDIAGNPLDPTFNESIFTATAPLLSRSLFTDRGPITKPPLTLQSGTAATLDTFEAVTLPGAVFTLSDIGKRLRLMGSAANDSVYEVLSIVSTNKAKVRARFILPDANTGVIDWELFDPRTGQIADEPNDVTVRVGGVSVVPEAVVGLAGQIILPGAAPSDAVVWLFDGLDDEVVLGEAVLAFSPDDAFSLSIWFSTTQPDVTPLLLGRVDGQLGSGGPTSGYQLMLEAGSIALEITAGTSTLDNFLKVYTHNSFGEGERHHALVTYSGNRLASGITIDVDGVAQVIHILGDDLSGTTVPTTGFRIGKVGQNSSTFSGVLSHASAWNIKLSGSQALEVYGGGTPPDLLATTMASSLVGWWKLDETDGVGVDGILDHSTGANHGTASGGLAPALSSAVSGPVEVDYSWISNPKVEVRRLNSLEFRLNAWNRDVGGSTPSGHHYRYRNVLVTPSTYESDYLSAPQEQPLLRDLAYRAYERAYTAVFNDPTKLLFNTPIHRIAFPPASRRLSETAVFYEATTLPEAAPRHPWVRRGVGSAVAAAGTLVVVDDSAGTFPTGSPLFWTQSLDLSFDHVFSAAWRFSLDTVTTTEGVWTGIAAGYANTLVVYAVGYLNVEGVKKIGFLKRAAADAVAEVTSWVGGFDSEGLPTDAPVDFDWSVLHSYRLFTDQNGVAKLFVDGDVVETLRLMPDVAPFLLEMNAPFEEIQGAFFGSLSRPAQSTSAWDFYRYLIQPLNAQQTSPSSFVSYEASDLPELDASPWTPVGFHGTSTVLNSDRLVLDSTSAAGAAASAEAGLIGGDFRGYVKLEPLLSAASQIVVDVQVQLVTHTHGIDPDGLMLAVDDGTRLLQLCFLSGTAVPKFSYGGRALPEDFSPYVWSALGSQVAEMRGRILRIVDQSTSDGRVYFIHDDSPVESNSRVVAPTIDYMLEARLEVVSYTVDGSGFAGAFAQVFDGLRSVGILLQEIGGEPHVTFQSDGVTLGPSGQFQFAWDDACPHTYRVGKSTSGDLVTLFVDGALLGSLAYSEFATPSPGVVGIVSFGSATPASDQAQSVVDWSYCNAWRVLDPPPRRYVGLWKGVDRDSLTGYHLPVKASGNSAAVIGNVLEDSLADFVAANVAPGDPVVVDSGSNKGIYEVATVVSTQKLTIIGSWPSQPSAAPYRIIRETDWSILHKYRLARDSTGAVSVWLDALGPNYQVNYEALPLLAVDYDTIDLPAGGSGVVRTLSSGIPAMAFGSFSPENLEQSRWFFVRYGITRSSTDDHIVPPHQVLNQWNVMESPERLFTLIPHTRTSYVSSSTGVTPQIAPDFLERDGVSAYTRLNQGTPLVPETQAFENRKPFGTQSFASSLDGAQNVLNGDGDFALNDGALHFRLVVPDDVLYSSLQVIRSETGVVDLLASFDDEDNPHYGGVEYQREACLDYAGLTLPEDDSTASTPWVLNSDDPEEVSAAVSGVSGVLTYGTGSAGTQTVYLNNTPLLDSSSLQTEATFRIRLTQDTTLGVGDSQVRFGLSAPGMTVGIGFVTYPSGDRFVEIFDMVNGQVMGRATVDYLDGAYHDYRIVRDPSAGIVEVYVSPGLQSLDLVIPDPLVIRSLYGSPVGEAEAGLLLASETGASSIQITDDSLNLTTPGQFSASATQIMIAGAAFSQAWEAKLEDGTVKMAFFDDGLHPLGTRSVARPSITGTTTEEQIDSLVSALGMLAGLGLITDDR